MRRWVGGSGCWGEDASLVSTEGAGTEKVPPEERLQRAGLFPLSPPSRLPKQCNIAQSGPGSDSVHRHPLPSHAQERALHQAAAMTANEAAWTLADGPVRPQDLDDELALLGLDASKAPPKAEQVIHSTTACTRTTLANGRSRVTAADVRRRRQGSSCCAGRSSAAVWWPGDRAGHGCRCCQRVVLCVLAAWPLPPDCRRAPAPGCCIWPPAAPGPHRVGVLFLAGLGPAGTMERADHRHRLLPGNLPGKCKHRPGAAARPDTSHCTP